jgi:hypothetical protein
MRAYSVGDQCYVQFLNFDGVQYVKTNIDKNFRESLEKSVDSGRGYAIKLNSDDGRSMWVGLGFHDRNDGFDLYCALEDFQKNRNLEKNADLFKTKNQSGRDYSLKPGQMIEINMPGGEGKSNQGSLGFDNPFQAGPSQGFSSG